MKKTLIIMIILVIVVGVAAFYGGMKYAASKQSALSAAAQQRFGQNGTFANRQNGASAVSGQIVSKNDQSMTVQLRDGSSKIVFYSSSTEVGKFVTGTTSDLVQGANVMISGTANSDGSFTAQSVQIRPNLPVTPASGNTPATPPVQ
ncbi:MAG: DUF5666 domain-containing protein [Candidatus Parcubacteria bacterium]|nr:DUF5666 domain-containing protein [Candidatus Parcubacteria bacterium]